MRFLFFVFFFCWSLNVHTRRQKNFDIENEYYSRKLQPNSHNGKKKKKIVRHKTINEMMIDEYIQGEEERVSHSRPCKLHAH